MENVKINRAALGSIASLGDLYDARRDDFCGISIFSDAIPQSAITICDADFSDIRLVHSDNFSEKAAKLDVSAELQVSVLAGLFTLKGSARYLSDQKQSARTVKSSLVYNIKTKEESLNIYHRHLRDVFAMDAIESGMATHVVVGISWGANSILSCFYENKENRDVREIEGSLSASLKKATLSISGGAKVEFNESDKEKGIKFEIHVYGDVISKDRLPTTFEKALEFMAEVPNLVQTCNDGKGKPLMYHLLPVSLLKSYLSFSLGAHILIKKLEEESLARVVQMFEQISEVQQKLNDFRQDAIEHRYCVREEDFKAITLLKNQVSIRDTSFRSRLSQMLQDVRSGKSEVDQLELLFEEFQSGDLSPENVTIKMTEWSSITDKIRLARLLGDHGAKYIGNGTSLDEEMLENFDAMSYVLYFTQDAMINESNRWKGNRQIFFQELKKQADGHRYFVVDCDIHSHLKFGNFLSRIQTAQSGNTLVEDLLEEQQKTLKHPQVQLGFGNTVRIITRPDKSVPLEIPCAGVNCNPTTEYNWNCKKCHKIVEYGFDDHIYCVCVKTPVLCMEFKCTDPKHGITFDRHEENFLKQLLTKYETISELNILLLGEPGKGKSTWINAFINYLTYDSVEEAMKGKPVYLVPPKFCQNEDEPKKDTQVYVLSGKNTTIRLIDAADSMDDYELTTYNFYNTLANLGKIHGICIFLGEENELTPVLDAILREMASLITTQDCSQNIVACFAKHGVTMGTLILQEVQIPLNRNTTYHFESKSFELLLSRNKNPKPLATENEQVSQNWERSFMETKRMFEYFQSIPPLDTKNIKNRYEVICVTSRVVFVFNEAYNIIAYGKQKNMEFQDELITVADIMGKYIHFYNQNGLHSRYKQFLELSVNPWIVTVEERVAQGENREPLDILLNIRASIVQKIEKSEQNLTIDENDVNKNFPGRNELIEIANKLQDLKHLEKLGALSGLSEECIFTRNPEYKETVVSLQVWSKESFKIFL